MEKESGYGNIKILTYFVGLTHGIDRGYMPLLLVASMFKALTPLINVIMPKYIIEELMGEQRIEVFIRYVFILVVSNLCLHIINKGFERKINVANTRLQHSFDTIISEKIATMDFENIEDPEVLDLKERALFAIYNHGAVGRMIRSLAQIISDFISVVSLSILITTLNPLILMIIIIIVALNSKIFCKIQRMTFEESQKNISGNRAFGYYGTLTSDFSLGKDIRLYNIGKVIMMKIRKFNKLVLDINILFYKKIGALNGLSNSNVQIQIILVYGYLIYKAFINDISIGELSMYAGITMQLSTFLSSFINTIIETNSLGRYLELYIQFMNIVSITEAGHDSIDTALEHVIEFQNVSFRYPRQEKYALKNISIVLKQNEKLSVVGSNGAGKTTFVKLLARLYTPTEGKILLNGKDIAKYDLEEYMKILSVVFQDFKLLAFTVKENIAFQSEVDDEEIYEILNEAGLENDIRKLDKGLETSIYKSFDKDGIELSGGQSQKLALSRALYKGAPIVILDEPTAALDPFAEYEIYNKFNSMVQGKTAIYISHRLSSCKFCDHIAVFEQGEIIQYGTHDELIEEYNGQYAKMYSAQAQYYV